MGTYRTKLLHRRSKTGGRAGTDMDAHAEARLIFLDSMGENVKEVVAFYEERIRKAHGSTCV
jgi:hypothetical protein